MNKYLRHFDDSSPITMCIESKISPLIKADGNGDISCFNTLKEKLYAIENRGKNDKFIIAWSGKWRTDVFEVTEEDMDLLLLKY